MDKKPLQLKPGFLPRREPHPQKSLTRLCCASQQIGPPMTGSGQTGSCGDIRGMTALPPKSKLSPRFDRSVPNLGHGPDYSITLSARTKSVSDIARRSILAVLRLMTSSNFVGCSIGRSSGLAPLRMRSTKYAARRYRARMFTP